MTTLPKKPLPKDGRGQFLLTPDVACQVLGVSRASLANWMREDNPPPQDPSGGYPAKDFGEWVRKRQTLKQGRGGSLPYLPPGVVIQDGAQKGGLPSALAKKDYNAERTRKEAAQADKIEMENAVASGELIRAEDVEKGWADILSRVKTRMMRVPFAAARVVVGDDDMVSVQKKIADFVRDALSEMSADWREGVERDEEDEA